MNAATVDAWKITMGALRRAAVPFWGAMGGGAFITGSAFLIAKLGWPSIGNTFVKEAFGPSLAGFFLILWIVQAGITWRPAILNRCEDWLLNSFLALAGALVGAAIILMGVIAWSVPSIEKKLPNLFGFVLLVVIVVHALTGTAAFLRDYPHREDARQLRLILGCVALIAGCQTNANSSQFPSVGSVLGRKEATPLGESGGAVQLEILTAVEGALLVKVVMDRGMDGCEFLQCSHPPEAKHCPLPPSKRLVRILCPVVGPPASFLKIRYAEFPQRRAV